MAHDLSTRGRLIGYARVSTDEQSTASQAEELRAAGCTEVREEHGSGGSRARPVLNQVIGRIGKGDTLVVVRLDRLARSLSHLLEVIEGLERKGAFFRSLRDPVDTSSPQGKFTLQVLGAAAELERALIRERTISGLESARAQGRVGGNPGLKAGDPAALRKIARGRAETRFNKLEETAHQWVPEVRRLRPQMTWDFVVSEINRKIDSRKDHWSKARLVRAVKLYVREGLLDPSVLERAPLRSQSDRQMAVVAAIAGADPDITLAGIAARLEEMRERTPRGSLKWQTSTVKMLLDRARKNGLVPDGSGDSRPIRSSTC